MSSETGCCHVKAWSEPRQHCARRIDGNRSVPPRGLHMGWSSPRPDLAALRPGTSLIEIELEPHDHGTRLRLRHSGLPNALQPIHAERWFVYLSRLAIYFQHRAVEAKSL